MVAQATDSGSSNPLCAKELEQMFLDCDDPIFWDSKRNQIRCYCHKLALTVKAGFESIGFAEKGRSKPSIPAGKRLRLLLPNDALPAPKIVMADGTVFDEDGTQATEEDSDSENADEGLFPGPDVEASDDSEDEELALDYKTQRPDADLLPRALTKVSFVLVILVNISLC